jgi:serine/threonine protein kinase
VCNDEYCGSPHYAAPELWLRKPYTSKVDVWALGMTMYACLTGSLPFDCDDQLAMEEAICAGLPDLFETDKLDHVSCVCRDLLNWMLTADQDGRPTARNALAHPWFDDIGRVDECTRGRSVISALVAGATVHPVSMA